MEGKLERGTEREREGKRGRERREKEREGERGRERRERELDDRHLATEF